MKIAISGTHSTGKSTALKVVHKHLEDKGLKIKLVSDLAVRCPLPILRDHTPASSLWIAASGVSGEISCGVDADVVLVDRPVIDSWGYLMAATTMPISDSPALRTLEAVIQRWIPSYDAIFATQLDSSIKIEDAKNRDLDEEYRAQVAQKIRESYAKFDIKVIDLTSKPAADLIHMVDRLLNH